MNFCFIHTLFKTKQVALSILANILSFKFLFISILISFSNISFSQTTKIDSLNILLSKRPVDLDRALIMNELSERLQDIDPKLSRTYAEKVLKFSRDTKNKAQEIKAMHNLGELFYDSPQKESAFHYFVEGERMAEQYGFGNLQADHLMSLGNWYRYAVRDSTKATNYLQKSVEVSKVANYTYGVARSYAKLASFYTRYHEFELFEHYMELAAEYYLKLEGMENTIAHYYNELGNKVWAYNPQKAMDLYFKGLIYSENHPTLKISLAKAYVAIGEPKRALKYLKSAVEVIDTVKYSRILGLAQSQMAEVYLQLGDYATALKISEEGIMHLSSKSRSNQTALPSLLRIKASIFDLKGNDEQALAFYLQSLSQSERIDRDLQLAQSNIAVGNYYVSRAPEEGKKYCLRALEHSQQYHLVSFEIAACECLSKIHKATKYHKEALKYFERKIELSDSLGTLKVEQALAIRNKIAKKDIQLAEEAFLRKTKEEKLENQYIISTILFFAAIVGLLLIGSLSISIRRISKQNIEITKKTEELEHAVVSLARSNEELENFAYVASHDLRSPLNTIISFTELIRQSLNKTSNPKVKNWLNIIENSGRSMSQQIMAILAYSKLSSPTTGDAPLELVNLNELVDDIARLVLLNPDGKSVKIEASTLPNLNWNYSKLFLLLKNLIENGLKYNTTVQPTVKLYHAINEGVNSIYVEDNGIGLEEAYFEEIFQMFNRLHAVTEYDGTGLGLATCRKIVDEFQGDIRVSSSVVGAGSIFKIDFPRSMISSLKVTEITTMENS